MDAGSVTCTGNICEVCTTATYNDYEQLCVGSGSLDVTTTTGNVMDGGSADKEDQVDLTCTNGVLSMVIDDALSAEAVSVITCQA